MDFQVESFHTRHDIPIGQYVIHGRRGGEAVSAAGTKLSACWRSWGLSGALTYWRDRCPTANSECSKLRVRSPPRSACSWSTNLQTGSTPRKSIAGVQLLRAGSIHFRGRDLGRLPSYERTKLGVALVPEGTISFHSSRCARILNWAASSTVATAPECAVLSRTCSRRFRECMSAVRRKPAPLAAAANRCWSWRAMMSEPILLCLDEPSLGLAPMVVKDIFRTIRAINAAGVSILLVEQTPVTPWRRPGAVTCCRLAQSSPVVHAPCCGKMSPCPRPTLVAARCVSGRADPQLEQRRRLRRCLRTPVRGMSGRNTYSTNPADLGTPCISPN